MTNDRSYFSGYSHTNPIRLRTAIGDSMEAVGKGTILTKFTLDGTTRYMILFDVLYVPSLSRNTISMRKLTEGGYTVSMGGGKCRILDSEVAVVEGNLSGGLYVVSLTGIKRSDHLVVA